MLTTQSAIRAKLPEFEFAEKMIPLNLRFGAFITMNPGYAVRVPASNIANKVDTVGKDAKVNEAQADRWAHHQHENRLASRYNNKYNLLNLLMFDGL